MNVLREMDGVLFCLIEKLEGALFAAEQERAGLKRAAYAKVDRLPKCFRCDEPASRCAQPIRLRDSSTVGLFCDRHAPPNPIRCSHFGLGKCVRFAIINGECWVHAPWPEPNPQVIAELEIWK